MVLRCLVLSGGPTHSFDETSLVIAAELAELGIECRVADVPDGLADLVEGTKRWDLVVVNALRWRMQADRYESLRDGWVFELDPEQERALERHVRGGGGLVAVHTAVVCFDGSDVWRRLVGGVWNWDRSSHAPLGAMEAKLTDEGRSHPVTAGLDDFTIVDEAYGFLDLEPDVRALVCAEHDGEVHPMVWAREVGSGRVVTELFGHDARSFSHPAHTAILANAARWALDRSEIVNTELSEERAT